MALFVLAKSLGPDTLSLAKTGEPRLEPSTLQTAVWIAGPLGALLLIGFCFMLPLYSRVLKQIHILPKNESARIIRLMLWLSFTLTLAVVLASVPK